MWFTSGALFLASLGAVVAAQELRGTRRGMARVGSGGFGAICAGQGEALEPVLLASVGAAFLAVIGALSAARGDSVRTTTTSAGRGADVVMAGIASAFAVTAIACIIATGFVLRARLGLDLHDEAAQAALATLTAVIWWAWVLGVLAVMSSSLAIVASVRTSSEPRGVKAGWRAPALLLVGAVTVALIVLREMDVFLEAAKRGRLPD